jgi:hypothetical protein
MVFLTDNVVRTVMMYGASGVLYQRGVDQIISGGIGLTSFYLGRMSGGFYWVPFGLWIGVGLLPFIVLGMAAGGSK